MRYAELTFLVLMVAYHAVLLVPRRRRPFPANYLVFLAGMALAWNLGLEGLRWQTLPPLVLLLVDLAVLFPTFSTLRGRPPRQGFLFLMGGFFRSLTASLALMLMVASTLLAVAFPLPAVGLTGGLTPSLRLVRFPPDTGHPGMELRVWYPAAGDLRPLPREVSEKEAWGRIRDAGGVPVFWSSYLEHLPTNLIRGGRMAAPDTRYPVIFAALPAGENPGDFGYLFEDLASRGFIVAAGSPLPSPLAADPPFSWAAALSDLTKPVLNPGLWTSPDAARASRSAATDYRWLAPAREALGQLASQPGDVFFQAVDGKRQALWAWGPGNLPDGAQQAGAKFQGLFHAGGPALPGHLPQGPELWVAAGKVESHHPSQWVLSLAELNQADLSDSAYLRPYLAFGGLKAQPDAGLHGALRQYQAAFYQHIFWGQGSQASFRQTVPEIQGLVLSGK